jgi:hypothetical protein
VIVKRAAILLLVSIACIGASWAALQTLAPEAPPLSHYVPAGSLLYLQAKDFSALLGDWNASPQKASWVQSKNYEVYSRSRLFLRLQGASNQFAAAAGLPPDINFLTQVAGTQSALALYDIGKLEFLYLTKLPAASSTQSTLWQTRAKFEARSAAGLTFYVRRDPESGREVAFAVNGDYLILATREDLLAGALQLMAGSKDRTIEAEQWWSQAVAAGGSVGDLRMVLNLEKIVPSPYFRSYWIQRNITDMSQYSAAVSDLFRSGKEYREERVMLKKSAAAAGSANSGDGAAAVADLLRLLPADSGTYEVRAAPSAADCFSVLETKILAPHMGPAVAQQIAPQVQLSSGETGAASDLETRIDQAPSKTALASDVSTPLKDLFQKAQVRAILNVQATERDKDGVFVRIHSGIAFVAATDWPESSVRSALVDFLQPSLTTGNFGVHWQAKSGYQELDGLWNFAVAVRGKYLLLSDDSSVVSAMLANMNQKPALKPAVLVAGFSHARERENFARLTDVLDRPRVNLGGSSASEPYPQFFSDNLASFSTLLAGVSSQTIVVRDASDKVLQTVTYEWSR